MTPTFSPCGVISVTTDFGHRGPFVGTMKGVILQRLPQAQIVDLTHEVHVHWPAEAGFWLERAYRYFPTGTVHLAVVDPGVGTARNALLAIGDGQAFLAPDNSLLAGVIERTQAAVFRLEHARLARFGIGALSATFHGRDLFAPLAAELAAGRARVPDLGVPVTDHVPALIEPPLRVNGELRGVVVTTDHFGNLITNLDAALLEGHPRASVRIAGRRVPLHRTYGDVPPGTLLALVNSFGVLEVASAEQNAAAVLGLGRGAPVVVELGSQAPAIW